MNGTVMSGAAPSLSGVHARYVSRKDRLGSCKLAVLLLLILACTFASVAGAQESARAKALGQKLICACGCTQVLTACNHIDCPYSPKMLAELNQRVARGDSDDAILQSFVQEYGLKVLAEPPTKGFDLAAWIVPIVAPVLAIFLIWALVRRWRERASLATVGGPDISPELLSRARDEASRDADE